MRLRSPAVLTLAVLAALGLAAPALAHPFGPPLRVELEGLNHVVNLRWAADEDDWIALARHTGAFEEIPAVLDGEELSGTERIIRSRRVHDYLLDRILVTQQGHPCAGALVHAGNDLTTEGMVFQFRCEEQVYEVDVEISALTDVHEAYRTVAHAPAGGVPGRALYTRAEPVHRWDFYAEVPDAHGAERPAWAVGTSTALVLAAGVLLVLGFRGGRRGSRRGGRPPEPPEPVRRDGAPRVPAGSGS